MQNAAASLAKYRDVTAAAVKIDASILKSTRREMDSNLKYCQRVATDIEVSQGTPLLNEAIAACDAAIAGIQEGSSEATRTHYEKYKQLRDKALATSPSLNDIFSARSQINRCDRFERKILSFEQQMEESTRLVELAITNSENYAATCADTLKGMSQQSFTPQDLASAQASLQGVRQLKTRALQDSKARKFMADDKFADQRQQFDKHIKTGDQCVARLEKTAAEKESAIIALKAELTGFSRELGQQERSCQQVQQAKSTGMAQTRYKELSKQFDTVVANRDRLQSRMSRSTTYQKNRDWPEARRAESALASLNGCIEKSSAHLTVLLKGLDVAPAAVVAAVASTPPPQAAQPVSPAQAKAIQGTIHLATTLPQVAIVYLLDERPVSKIQDMTLTPSGFDSKFYAVATGDTIRIRSRDFNFHRTDLTIPGTNFSYGFAWLQSRQQKDVQVSWPENTIATLRSDRTSIVPTLVANIPTRQYALLDFDASTASSTFELPITDSQSKGYILMSGFDPIAFDLPNGESAVLEVVRESTVAGNVTLQLR